MKVVILAGGRGSRMEHETAYIPKPMVEIGGKPILWHIMKHYSYFGFRDFVICLGYKGWEIKNYFINIVEHNYDFTIHRDTVTTDSCEKSLPLESDWKVSLVDTGLDTQTGGRLKKIQKYVENETFLATYGDGVSDIDLDNLITAHKKHGRWATLTGIHQKSKFGTIEAHPDGKIYTFEEKSKTNLINGGFFVFEPDIFDYISGDDDPLESGLLSRLTRKEQLYMYEHKGFWGCIDNPKELGTMNDLWNSGNPPWKIW